MLETLQQQMKLQQTRKLRNSFNNVLRRQTQRLFQELLTLENGQYYQSILVLMEMNLHQPLNLREK